ncbi:MAG TPA: hypothetical protein VG497_27515 [Kribbella sp.]|nr:hypothetical protein [Kribbella sp.]
MPLPRLAVIALILALVTGCEAKPEAKYPDSLTACELLPRVAASRVTDVGAKLSDGQAKESHLLFKYKYCEWSYEQPRKHAWSPYQPGPVERRLTIRLTVISAGRHGAAGAAGEYTSQRDSRVKDGAAVADLPGPGESAFMATDEYGGRTTATVWFRRSNAVVQVELSGRDCCRRTSGDMQAANRRKLVIAAATAADQTLLTR